MELDYHYMVKIPYYEMMINSSSLFIESTNDSFDLDCNSSIFFDVYYYLKTNNVYKNTITKEKKELYDYLGLDDFIKKLIDISDRKHLIDNEILTREEIIMIDCVRYKDKLIFDDKKDFEKYLNDINNYNLNKEGMYGLIHSFVLYCNVNDYNFDMIFKNTNINLQDINGNTALIFACYGEYTNIVKLLIENHKVYESINVNMKNKDGNTCFILACSKGYINIVKLLMENFKEGVCIDINLKNKYGYSGLSIACSEGHTNIVDLLI